MAILESRTKTGISWVAESVTLFKQAPRKLMLLALVYLGLFVLLPSMPGMQIFAFATILIWPVFISVAMRIYRNVEVQKEENLQATMQLIQPKMKTLIILGFVNLFYFILVSIILSSDMQTLASIIEKQNALTDQEMAKALQTMMPIFLKLALMFIPLLIIGWFSPMLIAFNHYSLGKAIKSSIAGSLQYIVALIAAWLLISAGMVTLMMVASLLVGLFAMIAPAMAQSLVTIIVFGCFLLTVAITFSFQYVTYRDIFRAAPI